MWAQAGDIPAYRFGGVWRFKQSEVEAWLHAKENLPKEDKLPWHFLVDKCADQIVRMISTGEQKFWLIYQFDHLGRHSLVDAAIDLLERRGECEKTVAEVRPGTQTIVVKPKRKE